MGERVIIGGPGAGTVNVAHSDGTNDAGSNGVAPQDPPKPRGEQSTHYDHLNERMDAEPDRKPTARGIQRIKDWLNGQQDDEQEDI